jgi:hypothetical protein
MSIKVLNGFWDKIRVYFFSELEVRISEYEIAFLDNVWEIALSSMNISSSNVETVHDDQGDDSLK